MHINRCSLHCLDRVYLQTFQKWQLADFVTPESTATIVTHNTLTLYMYNEQTSSTAAQQQIRINTREVVRTTDERTMCGVLLDPGCERIIILTHLLLFYDAFKMVQDFRREQK